ncbi:MAG: arginine--tRNA ligase, partial [Thermoanaerobaculia bacterium]
MAEPLSLDSVRSALADAIREGAQRLSARVERVVLERPPRLELGDLACPAAFDLAKTLRKAPRAIAADLAKAITLPAGVREVRVEGAGYLNFFLDRGALIRALVAGAPEASSREGKVIVEHTNINPNKAAHIGHLRNAVLGDVLVRTLRHLGFPVEVQNYLDDTGVQVADVVAGLVHLQNVTTLEAARAAIRESRLPGGAANPKGFAYLCWDLYAEVGRTYAARPETKAWRDEVLHAIEA